MPVSARHRLRLWDHTLSILPAWIVLNALGLRGSLSMAKYADDALRPVVLGVQLLFPSFVPPIPSIPLALLVLTLLACSYLGILSIRAGGLTCRIALTGSLIWMLMDVLGYGAETVALHLNAWSHGTSSPWLFEPRSLLWWQLPALIGALAIVGLFSRLRGVRKKAELATTDCA